MMKWRICSQAILFLIWLLHAGAVYSQRESSHFAKVTFGECSNSSTYNATTREKILEYPEVICREPKCRIIGYRIMILPKGQNLIGPYWTKGGTLSPNIIKAIKDLPPSKIYIDSIQVENNGIWAQTNSLLVFVK
jgi:hypothetical protein